MPELLLEPTPPAGLPEVHLEPCHTGKAALNCSYCQSLRELLEGRHER